MRNIPQQHRRVYDSLDTRVPKAIRASEENLPAETIQGCLRAQSGLVRQKLNALGRETFILPLILQMQPANARARDYQSTVGVVESRFHVLHFVWGSGGGYGAILREMRRAPRKRSKRDVPG
jgi:hypothetical protein